MIIETTFLSVQEDERRDPGGGLAALWSRRRCESHEKCGQATKGARWMLWRREAKKGVARLR